MDKIEELALKVARELRIKIHDMGESNPYPACRASNVHNSTWLDAAAKDGAPIVAAALREMAAYSYRDASTDAANWLGGKWELSQILQRKAESVENGGK